MLTCSALKSLFRILKARRLIFGNPATHLRTGRPETRTPLPIEDGTMRAALNSGNPACRALATLIGYHALRSGQVRALLLTDVRDGRLLPSQTHYLAGSTCTPLPHSLAGLPEHAMAQNVSIPHLFINIQTAVRTAQVSHVWINNTLGFRPSSPRRPHPG